jgi:hypothetical protein|uniref:Uncharacterized protein n=1 Tax=Meiothermus ruber TaxID=277 RepID=A0A7C3HUK6_MEIRU
MGALDRTYVVRIWNESCESGEVWRASATNVRTQEKHYFKSQEELSHFLEAAEHQDQQVQKICDTPQDK